MTEPIALFGWVAATTLGGIVFGFLFFVFWPGEHPGEKDDDR